MLWGASVTALPNTECDTRTPKRGRLGVLLLPFYPLRNVLNAHQNVRDLGATVAALPNREYAHQSVRMFGCYRYRFTHVGSVLNKRTPNRT